MKRASCLIALVLVCAVGLPRHAPAEGQQIRWDQVMGADPSRMNGEQRERAAALLRREFCYFGCSRTIARCLEAPQPNRTARRLAGYVVRQVLAGRTDEEVHEGIQQRSLSAHPLQTVTMDLSRAQCIGAANAPVTVVEFADFECPFCRVISPIMHRLAGQMQPDVRLCFRHFPVRGHDSAVPASVAALAASRQGRFWQMHDVLYSISPRLADENLVDAARRAGVANIDQWQQDRQDQSLIQLVEADKLEGLQNGVRGTPAIFVNGKEYLGRKDEAELRDRLEEELDIVRGQA